MSRPPRQLPPEAGSTGSMPHPAAGEPVGRFVADSGKHPARMALALNRALIEDDATHESYDADRVVEPATRHSPPRLRGDASFVDQLWCALHSDAGSEQTPRLGLPVPRLATPSNRVSTYYTVTAIDVWGRLADRSPLQRLQWQPGLPLAVSITQRVALVVPHRDGRHAVTRDGRLRLPAAVRRVCRLEAGDRLLLAACPARNFLVAYPMFIVDAMLLAYHSPFRRRTSR